MSVIWMESFEHLGVGQQAISSTDPPLLKKWGTLFDGGAGIELESQNTLANSGIHFSTYNNGYFQAIGHGFDKQLSEVILGVRLFPDNEFDTDAQIFSFVSSVNYSNNNNQSSIEIWLSEFNQILLAKNRISINLDNLNDPSYIPGKIKNQNWSFLEFHLGFDSTTGFLKVQVNNQFWFHATGLDTMLNNGYLPDFFYMGNVFKNDTNYLYGKWDDVYVIDPTDGIAPTGFLGDTKVVCSFPNQTGSFNNFIATDGSTTGNHTFVNESSPNTGNFVEGSGVGTRETFLIDGIPYDSTNFIHAIQLVSYSNKKLPGYTTYHPLINISGVAYTGNKIYQSTYPSFTSYIWNNNPANGSGFKLSDINNIEIGVEVGD